MHNAKKWPNNFKDLLVFTTQDFHNIFNQFPILYMKGLSFYSLILFLSISCPQILWSKIHKKRNLPQMENF